MTRRFAAVLVVVGVVVAAWSMLAIGARATRGTQTTADEPQYLLSALSLGEDLDLDISDEIRDRRFAPFHELDLNPQTEPNADGREFSPHDPLLPAIIALPMALGGWVAAKATLALLAGVLAATLVWVAVRRFDVPLGPAALVVVVFGLTPPLTSYGTQVYPELPAALAVTASIAALTSPRFGRSWGPQLVWLATLVALPWLAVKYAPVVAVLGLIGAVHLVRGQASRRLTVLVVGATAAALAYVVVHRLVYGGWTVYASGDHFTTGEAGVIGFHPNYVGRARRLVGLLVDNTYGLAVWSPVYLMAIAALGALVRRRPSGWAVLVAPLAVGWLNATFVALTMHGWWWPGRQVVVVIPALVLATAWWVGRRPRLLSWVLAAGAIGIVFWIWLLVEVWTGAVTLIYNFEAHNDVMWQLWRDALPPGRETGTAVTVLTVAWTAIVAAIAWWGWTSAGGDEDPGPGELAEANVAPVDLDRGGAVR